MSEDTRRLLAEVDAEIDRLATSVDPAGTDEPELEPFSTRLHSLHDAIVAEKRGEPRT